jgi:hypothetical protein
MIQYRCYFVSEKQYNLYFYAVLSVYRIVGREQPGEWVENYDVVDAVSDAYDLDVCEVVMTDKPENAVCVRVRQVQQDLRRMGYIEHDDSKRLSCKWRLCDVTSRCNGQNGKERIGSNQKAAG